MRIRSAYLCDLFSQEEREKKLAAARARGNEAEERKKAAAKKKADEDKAKKEKAAKEKAEKEKAEAKKKKEAEAKKATAKASSGDQGGDDDDYGDDDYGDDDYGDDDYGDDYDDESEQFVVLWYLCGVDTWFAHKTWCCVEQKHQHPRPHLRKRYALCVGSSCSSNRCSSMVFRCILGVSGRR